jgi:hypothetical protein
MSSTTNNNKRSRMSTSNPNYVAHRKSQLAEASRRSRLERKILDGENIALSQQLDLLRIQQQQLEEELNNSLQQKQSKVENKQDELFHEMLIQENMHSATFLQNMLILSQNTPTSFIIDENTKLSWKINQALDETKFSCMRWLDISSSPQPLTCSSSSLLTTSFQRVLSINRFDDEKLTCDVAFDGSERTPIFRVDWLRRVDGKNNITNKTNMKSILNQFVPNHVMSTGASKELTKLGVQTYAVSEFSWTKMSSEEEMRVVRQNDTYQSWMSVAHIQEQEQVLTLLQSAHDKESNNQEYANRGIVKCLTAVVAMFTKCPDSDEEGLVKQQWSVWQEKEGLMHVCMIACLPKRFSFGALNSRESIISDKGELGRMFFHMMGLGS